MIIFVVTLFAINPLSPSLFPNSSQSVCNGQAATGGGEDPTHYPRGTSPHERWRACKGGGVLRVPQDGVASPSLHPGSLSEQA